MTRAEFIEWLKSEITMSGTINLSLPDKEYNRIIDRELRMIPELYVEAVKYDKCVIPRDVFYSQEFRKNRCIKFPDCVLSVVQFCELKMRNQMWGIADPDLSWNRMFQTDMWMGPQMAMDTVMFRTIQWSNWDQLKQFNLVDIKHRWNRPTHQLFVTGHDPYNDVYCELATKVDDQDLFEDPWVRQWIAAKCKLQVVKKLGTFTVTAIGGVTVNTGTYSEEANNDINDCKEYWANLRQADFFETGY